MFSKFHRFDWPIRSEAAEKAIIAQFRESVSLYKKEGIYEQFEVTFADYHDLEHAVVFNSGTTAIWAMFGCLKLEPGDEILVPTYTFFATISPMIQWGLVPIFCDCSSDGNFDPDEIQKKVTNRTKAVIVTHMWGVPCDMSRLSELCKRLGLYLLEDCSHAHGASIQGVKVGAWGDIAAWSLQGKKLVSAGQGGIMATNNSQFYEKAVFLGHFNKRCFQEVSPQSPYRPYCLTGAGMNLRPSPLAIALAHEQFSHLDEWLDWKQVFAQEFMERVGKIPFLKMPVIREGATSAWYALVMQFEHDLAPCSREEFVRFLNNEYNLGEADIPMSTCPNHLLPLFVNPEVIRPDLYPAPIVQRDEFPVAKQFHSGAIKIFVPVQESDQEAFENYIVGFLNAADHFCH
ncbi:MAG: aminotransferase class I/II-fold pyridoxal phosphate-dependent enzyme [Coleofasciculaceae cyanobacterium]